MRLARNVTLHSRLVGWLKIILPLAALAILATLFLVARKIDPSDAIPYAEVDVQDRLRTPRMTDASYSGVTRDGTAINLQASQAVPGANGSASASGLHARLDAVDGSSTIFDAGSGQLDNAGGMVALTGGVRIVTSAGYHINTDALQMALDRTLVEAPGLVTAVGPPGKITADRMTLKSAEAKVGNYQLIFNGNVKLIYEPSK
jgi:lipopolysaccharide export system protein LptC